MNDMTINVIINKDQIASIIKKTVETMLAYDKYNEGEGARLVTQKTKIVLLEIINQFNYEEIIKDIFNNSFSDIARDVVTEELKKIVRKIVKEMQQHGELLNNSNQ